MICDVEHVFGVLRKYLRIVSCVYDAGVPLDGFDSQGWSAVIVVWPINLVTGLVGPSFNENRDIRRSAADGANAIPYVRGYIVDVCILKYLPWGYAVGVVKTAVPQGASSAP